VCFTLINLSLSINNSSILGIKNYTMWFSNVVAKQIHIFFICGIEYLPSNIGVMNIIKEVGEVSNF